MARPGFRKPWEHGAKAYHEADTLEALHEGAKRKRKTFMLHVSHEGFGHYECAKCGIPVGNPYPVNEGDTALHQDKWATAHYSPKRKELVVLHYYCSWATLIHQVFALGRRIQVG